MIHNLGFERVPQNVARAPIFYINNDSLSSFPRALCISTHLKHKPKHCKVFNPKLFPLNANHDRVKTSAYVQIKKTGRKYNTQYRDTSVFINHDFLIPNDLKKFLARNPWVATFLVPSPYSASRNYKNSIQITIDPSLNGIYLKRQAQKDISTLCKLFLLWVSNKYKDVSYNDNNYRDLQYYWNRARKDLDTYYNTHPPQSFDKKFAYWVKIMLLTEDLFSIFLFINKFNPQPHRARRRTLILNQTCQSTKVDLQLYKSAADEAKKFVDILRIILSDPSRFRYYDVSTEISYSNDTRTDYLGIIRMYGTKNEKKCPTVHFRKKQFEELLINHSNGELNSFNTSELIKHMKLMKPDYFVYAKKTRDKVRLPDSDCGSEDTVSLKLNELNFLEGDIIQSLTAPLSQSNTD